MRHAVHKAQAHIRIRHASDVGGISHLFTSILVSIHALRQILRDHADRLHRQRIGKAPGPRRDHTFDGVREGVETCGHLEAARHAVGQVRVHERHDRNVVRVDGHELALVLRVGDHVVDRGLRSGAGGRRHAEDRHARVLGGGHAFKREHVGELRVRHHNANALACVLRAAAAETDEEVGARLLELLNTVLDVLDRWVRLHIVEDLVRDLRLVEHIGHFLHRAVLHEHGIGDNERLRESARLRLGRDLLDRTPAKIRGLVENHAVDHVCTPFGNRVVASLERLLPSLASPARRRPCDTPACAQPRSVAAHLAVLQCLRLARLLEFLLHRGVLVR